MKKITHSLILLLMAMTLFFNIERFDYGVDNLIDIQTFVYVLGIVAVMAIIAFPFLHSAAPSRANLVFLGIYLVAKLGAIISGAPAIGGLRTYVMITEVSFLSILIGLAHHLARQLHILFQDIEASMLASSGEPIERVEEASLVIKSEVQRSRYYGHPMSVVVVKVDDHSVELAFNQIMKEIQEKLVARYVRIKLAKVIRGQLRLMDQVFEKEDGTLVILCPEVDGDASFILTERIQSAANQVGIQVQSTTASFPEDAITFESLVEKANKRLQKPSASDQKPQGFDAIKTELNLASQAKVG